LQTGPILAATELLAQQGVNEFASTIQWSWQGSKNKAQRVHTLFALQCTSIHGFILYVMTRAQAVGQMVYIAFS
jgi:hypothetical protein